MRVLVVEDDHGVAKWIAAALARGGHEADVVTSAADADRAFASAIHQLLIVDIGLTAGERQGDAFIRDLRARGFSVPVIALSGGSSEDNIETAYDAGADDYIIKPVTERTLLAHIRGVARRTRAASTAITYGDVRLDETSHRAFGPLGSVMLTGKECALLALLMADGGRVVPRAELLLKIWGFSFEPRTSMVEIAISRTRTKLKTVTASVQIVVLRHVGYSVRSDASDATTFD